MKKLLIVDDDEDALFIAEYVLKSFATVTTVSNYEKTFDALETCKPDVVLLDIRLRGEDGRNICKQIKDLHSSITVILFSASLNLLKTYKSFSADDYIEKPFDVPEFVNKVSYYLKEV